MSLQAQKLVERASGLPLTYVHEVRAGIPLARNAVLQAARNLNPDWIAFVDDDEVIDREWLIEMAAAMERWPADVYHGWTHSTPEDANAPWALHRPRNKRIAGPEMETAGTDNIVFSTSAVTGLRFDEGMRFSGGTDIDFFYRITDRGSKIIWVLIAIVREVTPTARLSFSYQVRRAYSVAGAQAYITQKRLGKNRAIMKVGPKASGRVIGGSFGSLAACLILLFNARKGRRLMLSSCKKTASAIGLTRGTNASLG